MNDMLVRHEISAMVVRHEILLVRHDILTVLVPREMICWCVMNLTVLVRHESDCVGVSCSVGRWSETGAVQRELAAVEAGPSTPREQETPEPRSRQALQGQSQAGQLYDGRVQSPPCRVSLRLIPHIRIRRLAPHIACRQRPEPAQGLMTRVLQTTARASSRTNDTCPADGGQSQLKDW